MTYTPYPHHCENNILTLTDLQILEKCFCRMDAIDQQCPPGQFPLYSIGCSNQWVFSQGGSWTGGFWTGCWWLRYLFTESKNHRDKAHFFLRLLSNKMNLDSINRSMIFHYGNAIAANVCHDPPAKASLNLAAQAIATSYQPTLTCFPLGNAMGGGDNGHTTISIDSLAATIQLLKSANTIQTEKYARNHLTTLIRNCLTDHGAWYPTMTYSGKSGFSSKEPPGIWARGQAWGLLGLAKAASYWGEPYLGLAKSVLAYWQNFIPNSSFAQDIALDRLQPNSTLSHQDPCCRQPQHDPSAMLIAFLASMLLDTIAPSEGFSHRAKNDLVAILGCQYISTEIADKEIYFFGSNMKITKNKNAMVESTWGLYFLMLSIAIKLKRIGTDAI